MARLAIRGKITNFIMKTQTIVGFYFEWLFLRALEGLKDGKYMAEGMYQRPSS